MKRNIGVPVLALCALTIVMTFSQGPLRGAGPQKSALSPEARKAILTVGDDMTKLVASHDQYVRASEQIGGLLNKLTRSVSEVSQLAAGTNKGAASKKLFQAIKDMSEMSQSFNMQYLDLQNQMSQENRQFSMISNIMKNKHDTAKNSIDNIR